MDGAPTALVKTWRLVHGAPGRASVVLTRRLFLGLVGLSFLVAFVSLWWQLEGLLGDHGITPVVPRLDDRVPWTTWLTHAPSLVWLLPSAATLHGLCGVGAAASLLLVVGVAPVLAAAVCFVAYLSLFTVGQPWLGYQWDLLLLEIGFLSIVVAAGWAPAIWLPRALCFRLMFSSGWVKFVHDAPNTWADGTALLFHFETQPLPTPLAWWMHQLPDDVLRAGVWVTFLAQCILPFGCFLPRRLRLVTCAGLAAFQVLIALTGNYAFFNLLALALCVSLLDDRLLRRGPRRRPDVLPRSSRAALVPAALATALLLSLQADQLLRMLGVPTPLASVATALRPFRLVGSYGLFARMTTMRPEIVLEGSRDGRAWLPYELPHKPGAPGRAPTWVAPHQPRLDWQMWFAALGDVRRNPWLVATLQHLLRGTPEVLALFAENPFPTTPPRFVRAVRHDYRMTDRDGRASTGRFYERRRREIYAGPYGPRRP